MLFIDGTELVTVSSQFGIGDGPPFSLDTRNKWLRNVLFPTRYQ